VNKIQIKLKIAERNYPLTIEATDEELVRKIAKVLNEKFVYYKNQYSSADAQDTMAMAAIDAVTTLSKSVYTTPDAVEQQIQHLEKLLA